MLYLLYASQPNHESPANPESSVKAPTELQHRLPDSCPKKPSTKKPEPPLLELFLSQVWIDAHAEGLKNRTTGEPVDLVNGRYNVDGTVAGADISLIITVEGKKIIEYINYADYMKECLESNP